MDYIVQLCLVTNELSNSSSLECRKCNFCGTWEDPSRFGKDINVHRRLSLTLERPPKCDPNQIIRS
jgi:hypothetical protein